MPVSSFVLAEIASAVFAIVFEEIGADAAIRQQVRKRLGKQSPEQMAFRLALERALNDLDAEKPGWTQSLFDAHLLSQDATARELAKLLSRGDEADARVLADAWAQSARAQRPDLQNEARQVATVFLRLLDKELDAPDVRPALAPLRDSRDLGALRDETEALKVLVEQVLAQVDAQTAMLSTQMEILAAASKQGVLQIQRRDVTIFGDASMVVIITGDGNQVSLTLPPELAREFSRHTGGRFSPNHLAYLRHWFGKTWAMVDLADMLKDQDGEISLLDVYVPLRVDFGFKIQVKDHRITDWWVDADETRAEVEDAALRQLEGLKEEAELAKAMREKTKIRRWDALGVNEQGMQAIVDGVQRKIDRRKAQGEETEDGEHSWFMEAQDAASVSQRFVLLGAPGSGKSSFLRHLTLCMAGELRRRAGEPDVPDKANLDEALNHDWLLDAYTPLYVEIRELVKSVFPALPEDEKREPAMPDVDHFWRYVKEHVLETSTIDFLPELQQLCARGEAILLLDGLDEAPQTGDTNRRKQIKRLVSALVNAYPLLRIIITSRPHAYRNHEWSLQGFGRTELYPLDMGRLRQLARALFAAVGEANPKEEADRFIKAIQQAGIETSMRGTPLFFTMLAALWLDQDKGARRLPTTKAALYRESVDLLIYRWEERRHSQRSPQEVSSVAEQLGLAQPNVLRAVLETLACTVQEQSTDDEDTTIFAGSLFAGLLYDAGVRVIPQDLTDYLSQHAGILVSPAPGQFHFVHKSFQEHLAACELTAQAPESRQPAVDPERRFPQGLIRRMQQQPDLWENVLELAVDELVAHGRTEDLWRLLAGLMQPYAAKATQFAQAAFQALRLAWQNDLLPVSTEQDAEWIVDGGLLAEREGTRLLIHAAAKALTDADHFPSPEDRDIAGRLLGQGAFPGHDPRPGVGVKNGLPEFVWVFIPAGEFLYGKKNECRTEDAFWITRYPVTYAQFGTFLRAEDGWRKSEWWEGLSASEKHRSWPDEQHFKYWNHPRENVSWYDAIAFSRWLTAKARENSRLLPPDLRGRGIDFRITLPTEWQWERAARGTDGRKYPWGPKYISGYANVDEKSSDAGPYYLQKTSAVGMYPQGASPDGVLDMSGNVWEWCLNEYENSECIQEAGDARRVLRGGSWYGEFDYASARFRFWGLVSPGFRYTYVGFRLVVAVSRPQQAQGSGCSGR